MRLEPRTGAPSGNAFLAAKFLPFVVVFDLVLIVLVLLAPVCVANTSCSVAVLLLLTIDRLILNLPYYPAGTCVSATRKRTPSSSCSHCASLVRVVPEYLVLQSYD